MSSLKSVFEVCFDQMKIMFIVFMSVKTSDQQIDTTMSRPWLKIKPIRETRLVARFLCFFRSYCRSCNCSSFFSPLRRNSVQTRRENEREKMKKNTNLSTRQETMSLVSMNVLSRCLFRAFSLNRKTATCVSLKWPQETRFVRSIEFR